MRRQQAKTQRPQRGPAGVGTRGKDRGQQNGIRSIIQHIGADFRRVRIGIGHPGHKDRVTGWVLGRANAEDDVLIGRAIADALAVLPLIAAGDFNEAQKRLNTNS